MWIQCRLIAKKEDEFVKSLNEEICDLQLMTDGRVGVMDKNKFDSRPAKYKPMTKEEVLTSFDIEKHHDNSETYNARFEYFIGKLKECLN